MKISIYIPTVKGDTKIKGIKVFKQNIEIQMSEMFGGCTTVKARGNWVDDSGKLISEKVFVITSYCDNIRRIEAQKFMHRVSFYVRCQLKQDCVAYVINDQMTLV